MGILTREEQALLVLGLEAYPHPLTLLVGLLEAGSVIDAAGGSRGRRPSMLATWANTLQVCTGARLAGGGGGVRGAGCSGIRQGPAICVNHVIVEQA